MQCANCGKEITGYNGTCEFCGNVAGNAMPPKKKGGKWKVIVPVVAGAGLVTAGAVMFAPYISNSFKKLTSSPEQYCQYVLQKNCADSQVVSGMYDTFLYQRLQSRKDYSFSGELKLELSDDAVDMLEDATNHQQSMEGLSDLHLSYTQQIKDNQAALEAKFGSGKKDLLTGELIFDGEDMVVYGIVPQINDDYAKLDLKEIAGDDDMEQFEKIFECVDVMAEAYPEPKAIQDMQERYLNLLIKEIKDVEESTDKVTIDGITQKFTVLTIRPDEEQLGNMLVAFADEAAEDETMKQFITSLCEMQTVMGEDSDPDEIWEQWQESLAEVEDHVGDIDFNGVELKIDLYVSGTGKIQGMDFTVENSDADEAGRMYFAYVAKGSNIAVEGKYENTFGWNETDVSLTGNGTLALGKLNGDFELAGAGDELEFGLKNVDVAGLNQGHVAGDLVVELSQFKKSLQSSGMKDLKDQAFTLSLDLSGKSSEIALRLEEGKDVFAAITLSGKLDSGASIKIPADSKCEEITDESEMQDYVDSCDMDALKDVLEDLGLKELAESGTDAMGSSMGGSVGSTMSYINNSKIAADTQLADSIHTAVLTAIFDPEVVNNRDYNTSVMELTSPVDITSYNGTNVILDAAMEILGDEDMHTLGDRIKSDGATGRIYVTITGNNSVEVVLEGTDDGHGSEITVSNTWN